MGHWSFGYDDISATPTAFVYKGTRFAFSPAKGLSFKSGATSVRMTLDPTGAYEHLSVTVYLNGDKIGSFTHDVETVWGAKMTPKLREVVEFGVEAWTAEEAKRKAKRKVDRQKAIDSL